MLNNLKKIILILPFITMLSCSESHIFSDKKNLNAALNDLFRGDFYSCNLIDDNDLENKKNSNTIVNLIYTNTMIGLIYKRDKWDHGNSIFIKKNENDNEFVLSSFYSESDFDRSILNIKHTAYFDKENLKVNLFDLVNHDNYGCMKLEKILSEAMKKEILKNFLLQKNADRQ